VSEWVVKYELVLSSSHEHYCLYNLFHSAISKANLFEESFHYERDTIEV
jgi:hypothetical protein